VVEDRSTEGCGPIQHSAFSIPHSPFTIPPAPPILILGPTASGKTELSLRLAERLPGGGECVCADSMQVYRGMDIGTAKPGPEERARAPHHLLDVVDPSDESFSVERWLRLAEASIAEITSRGRWPIVVGGTNLYVKSLIDGLFDGPPADEALRAELAALSLDELRERLEAVDPAAAERIHRNDRRRSIRAIEVHAATGQPISSLQSQWDREEVARADDSAPSDCDRPALRIIGLELPVETQNRRINDRVRQMVADGLVEEVRALHDAGVLGRQAVEALGYRQLVDHFEGRCSLEEAIEQTKIRTRRYAKQQRTWLRRFRVLPSARFFATAGDVTESLVLQVLAHIVGTGSQTGAREPDHGPK